MFGSWVWTFNEVMFNSNPTTKGISKVKSNFVSRRDILNVWTFHPFPESKMVTDLMGQRRGRKVSRYSMGISELIKSPRPDLGMKQSTETTFMSMSFIHGTYFQSS